LTCQIFKEFIAIISYVTVKHKTKVII